MLKHDKIWVTICISVPPLQIPGKLCPPPLVIYVHASHPIITLGHVVIIIALHRQCFVAWGCVDLVEDTRDKMKFYVTVICPDEPKNERGGRTVRKHCRAAFVRSLR